MKWLLSAALLPAFVSVLPAAPPTLKEARTLWLRGSYGQAQEDYETLLKDAQTAPAAALGLSRVFESTGEYDKALQTVDAALKDHDKNADLLARRAELLWLRGRWDEAEKAVDAALAADPAHLPAHWARARLRRDRGDVDGADADYKFIVKTYTDLSNADKDITDPDLLLIVGQAGAENARGKSDPRLADQFAFIVNTLCKDARENEADFWYADLLAGQLFLEKFNKPAAVDAFDQALKTNPRAAEALAGKAAEQLLRFEFTRAEELADQALKINPRLPEALRVLADVRLFAGDWPAALKELETARAVGPRDERTLGRIAACLYLQGKTKDAEALAAEVRAFDGQPGVFHYEFGLAVDGRRRFGKARELYEVAARERPRLPGPQAALGTLYMRLGQEKEGREALEAAFAADPFNIRVKNQIEVLKHLSGYATLKTDHFLIRYDPATDRALAEFMGDELEKIYADLSARFAYQPEGPILIEVFNNHEMFSGRVVALPDLHTVGACTGKMFAMVSPTGRGVVRPFNWARVVRHEMVHIFNLGQTDFLVPHWLTEGLAVQNEGFPRPPLFNEVLAERVGSGDLLNLDTIDLGFMRPRSRLEWTLAYAQANLYVEYVEKTYGKEAVAGLLAAYKEGLDTASALRKVCKVDKADFEKGYRAYLDKVVKELGVQPAAKKRSLEELQKAWEKDGDVDAGGELALLYLDRSKVKARETAEAVRAKKANQPGACLTLARLEKAAGNPKKERELLEAGLDRDRPDPDLLQALGKLYYDGMEYPKAAEVFELGRKAQPFEPSWLAELARVHAQTGDKDKLIGVLKELAPTDPDNLDRRRRLAKLLLEAGKPAEAETYAREALQINVRDAEARDLLLRALTEQKKDAEAERLRKLLAG